MHKFYVSISLLLIAATSSAQCPVINGAMVNSCAVGAGEGINEYVFFTTTASATAASYSLYYGNSAIPKGNSPIGVLFGTDATTKKSTGTISATGGCSVVQVTSSSTVIPANSSVLFIPASFDQTYDVTGICKNGSVYVVYINTTTGSSDWGAGGTLGNTPSGSRYIQITNASNECTSNIRSYQNGWVANGDGNAVSWNPAGEPTYFNNGCNNVVTPVKLTSFVVTGRGNDANIIWKTVSELNTQGFELERSLDGYAFKTIAAVISAGNSNELKSYAHTDLNIPNGTNYYRLKMIDRDGSYSYSAIVKIVNSHRKFEITNLYPKPATSQVTLSWNASAAGITELEVIDLSGKLLQRKSVPGLIGMNRADIHISGLAAGNYFIRLRKDGIVQTAAFSKQ